MHRGGSFPIIGPEQRGRRLELFKFDWGAFDTRAGLRYVAGVVVLIGLSSVADFPWMVAGVSALLAWLTDLPGPRRNRVVGALVFALAGWACVLLSQAIGDHLEWRVAALFAVTFVCTMGVASTGRVFMVGWCTAYLFLLVPVLAPAEQAAEVAAGHLAGSLTVVALLALAGLFEKDEPEAPPRDASGPGLGYAAAYSTTVAATMAVGLFLGSRFLSSDPTLISNAAFMVIGAGAAHTWKAGAERFIGALAGIIVGYYLGVALPFFWAELTVWIVMSFFVLALMNVNAGAAVFAFLVIFSFAWGEMGEVGNSIANERIAAEAAGVILAGIAVLILHHLRTRLAPEANEAPAAP